MHHAPSGKESTLKKKTSLLRGAGSSTVKQSFSERDNAHLTVNSPVCMNIP